MRYCGWNLWIINTWNYQKLAKSLEDTICINSSRLSIYLADWSVSTRKSIFARSSRRQASQRRCSCHANSCRSPGLPQGPPPHSSRASAWTLQARTWAHAAGRAICSRMCQHTCRFTYSTIRTLSPLCPTSGSRSATSFSSRSSSATTRVASATRTRRQQRTKSASRCQPELCFRSATTSTTVCAHEAYCAYSVEFRVYNALIFQWK